MRSLSLAVIVGGLIAFSSAPLVLAQANNSGGDVKPAPAKPATPAKPDGPGAAPQNPPAANPPATSQPAPTVKRKISIAGKSLNGKDIKVPGPDYAGKVVLVSVWATWCPHCKKEIPVWKEAYEQFHGLGLEMVGLPTDANKGTSADVVTSFCAEQGMKWEMIFPEGSKISIDLGAKSIPWSFLVDGDTGEVYADRMDVRGKENLAKQALAALAEKNLQSLPPPKASSGGAANPPDKKTGAQQP